MELNGNRVAIRTEALEEKYEALGNLVVVVQSVGVELGWDQLNAVAGVGLPLLKVCALSTSTTRVGVRN